MPRRKHRGPARSVWRTVCTRCGAAILWLPELRDYKRKWGPVNARPVPTDRWSSEAEHDIRGFALDGLSISGRSVANSQEATRYVEIFTRHQCEKRKPGRRDVPIEESTAWGADRQVSE